VLIVFLLDEDKFGSSGKFRICGLGPRFKRARTSQPKTKPTRLGRVGV
jgi:hypothetical protein